MHTKTLVILMGCSCIALGAKAQQREATEHQSSKTLHIEVPDTVIGQRTVTVSEEPVGKPTKKVKVLSGGERTRLAILKLLLEPVNLLILDEPTNHLDLKTKDILKQALQDFDGTLIVVSHDRDFLDGLVSKVYEFGHGRVREHLCGIYEFLESKAMENLQELEKKH